MPFLSNFEHALDSKGRVSVPASYRNELARLDGPGSSGTEIIISPYPAEVPVLWIFPPLVWTDMVEKKMAEASSPFDPQLIEFKRSIVQQSASCSLDSNGRILIPSELREFANLEGEVVLAGMNRYFEIWNAQRYRELVGGPVDRKLWENLG